MPVKIAIAVILTVAALLPVHASQTQVGNVKKVLGRWCRNGQALGNVPLFLDDKVTYCAAALSYKDSITIEFQPEHDAAFPQTYSCSMPDICGAERPALWLEGAYRFGGGKRGHGTPTISAELLMVPDDRATVPDVVIAKEGNGARLPHDFFKGLLDKSLELCSVPIPTQSSECIPYSPARDAADLRARPGLYRIYLQSSNPSQVDPKAAPSGLLLVVSPDSAAFNRWAAVPKAFRFVMDASIIRERRAFLLHLSELP